MPTFQVDYNNSPDLEPGPSFPIVKVSKKSRAIIPIPEITDDVFDDTHRLREAQFLSKSRVPKSQDNPNFQRGVPTNGATSSDNYDKDYTKIIDGEHKTLLSLGKISEALEEDEHPRHILAHRLLLSDPNLSETQRAGMLEHIADHVKKNRKKLKAVNEALSNQNRRDVNPTGGFRAGVGTISRPRKALTDDVIPQDADVDLERKRTAGNMAMESKLRKFDSAVRRSFGGSRRSL